MKLSVFPFWMFFGLMALLFCCSQRQDIRQTPPKDNETKPASVLPVRDIAQEKDLPIVIAAERTAAYFPLLEGKRIGLVVNHTSLVQGQHLVDSLLSAGFGVSRIFAPEHGFRGEADAGATVADGKDSATGLPIISLYGKNKKPSIRQLEGLDIVVFDIQDVGARFYTYISTMHYIMQACAEQGIPLLILDRPNPNGHYVDGPVRQEGFQSFVGMHPIPVVHGLTVVELARMINGEGWLGDGLTCQLAFVECLNYWHKRPYELPVLPSPNLPNARSVLLYPSLCFFEGTEANVGRGTETQFQVVGHPDYPVRQFSYTPESRPGARQPKFKGKTCYGLDLSHLAVKAIRAEGRINLSYLIDYYDKMPHKASFFLSNKFIDLLAGTDQLRKDIMAGKSEEEIRATWAADLAAYHEMRVRYLLYE